MIAKIVAFTRDFGKLVQVQRYLRNQPFGKANVDRAAEEIEIDTVERKLRRRDFLGDCVVWSSFRLTGVKRG